MTALICLAFAGCYRGPGTEDPRETSATAVVPWGTALLPGKSADASGIGYVTRRRECCGIATRSEFLVPNVRGDHALYFDFIVPVAGRRVTVLFGNGQKRVTDALAQGSQIVRVELPPSASDSTGAASVKLFVTATPPDHISAADGPTVMAFYGVTTDRDLDPASDILKAVVEAK